MKTLIVFLMFVTLAFAGAAEEKKPAPIPVPEMELFKLQYYQANAQLIILDAQKRLEENQKAFDAALVDATKKAGVDPKEYILDLQGKVFVKKTVQLSGGK